MEIGRRTRQFFDKHFFTRSVAMSGVNGNFRLMMKDMRQEARQQALEVSELKWQVMTLPVLRQVDNTFASISRELMRNHCPEDTFDSFNDSWEE
jgi:hypothetical protein